MINLANGITALLISDLKDKTADDDDDVDGIKCMILTDSMS